MDKCIMCGREILEFPTYVTDGKIAVCNECAAANSLMRVVTRVENRGYDANIKSVYVRPIAVEGSLVDQTENMEDSLVDQTAEPYKPQGYIPDCPFLPCEKCHFYYGEIDSCMVGEEGVVPTEEELDKVRKALGEEAARNFFAPLKPVGVMYDIENMSQDDFYSKYADNPAALDMWHDYHGEPLKFLEV